MATYSTDLTTLTTAESGTWTELAAPYNAGGTPAADGENFIQGTDCQSQTTGTKTGLVFSIIFDAGSDQSGSFATDDVVLIWCFYAVGVNLDTYANGGHRAVIASDISNADAYVVGGSNYGRNPYGGWFNAAIDPTLTADYTIGSGNGGAWRYFGTMPNTLAAISKGTPHAVDAIRYGRAEISITGTGGSFSELASYNDYNAGGTPPGTSSTSVDSGRHRLGLFQDNGGTYLWKGLMTLGTAGSSITFSDSNVTILIDDTAKTYAAFNKVEINNTSSSVTWTGVSMTALGTLSKGSFEVVDNATVIIDSCTFTDMNAFTFNDGTNPNTIDDSVFRRCGLVTTGGATFTGCTFDNPSGAVGVTASSPANAALITNSTFNSDGTGNGLEITGTAANMTLTNVDFNGYSTTVDANKAIYVNIASGTMTINISGGSGVTASSHVRTAGATVTVSADTTVTFTGMKDNTEVRVYENITETNTDISFTSTNTISSAGSGFGSFAADDIIRVYGSDDNDGNYTVVTASSTTLTVLPATITNESAGATVSIKKTNQTEIDGIENATAGTTDNRSFAWSAASSTVVDYVLHNWNAAEPFYQTIRVTEYTVPATDTSIVIKQQIDRNAS